MAEHTVAAPEVQTPPMTERTRHHERYVAPPVDIYETPDGLVVLADVPGMTKEALEVRVDHHVLTMRGQARHGIPGEGTSRDYDLSNFFRQFELSEKVDQSHITADLKSGVLTLHVPKAAEAKPRQIEVRVASTHGAPCRVQEGPYQGAVSLPAWGGKERLPGRTTPSLSYTGSHGR